MSALPADFKRCGACLTAFGTVECLLFVPGSGMTADRFQRFVEILIPFDPDFGEDYRQFTQRPLGILVKHDVGYSSLKQNVCNQLAIDQ